MPTKKKVTVPKTPAKSGVEFEFDAEKLERADAASEKSKLGGSGGTGRVQLDDIVKRLKEAIDATAADPAQLVQFTPLVTELEEAVSGL